MSANKCYRIEKYQGQFVPILATHDLDLPNQNVTTAIIAIHGLNENIAGAYDGIMKSINNYNAERNIDPGSVLVVVPWFHKSSVSSAEWSTSCGPAESSVPSFMWSSNSSWVSGGDSRVDPSVVSVGNSNSSRFVSSFGVLDDLHDTLTSGLYPSLRRVSYVGFSAGGQMINRYAWATHIGKQESATDIASKFVTPDSTTTTTVHAPQKGVEVRFIVSDASSYVYFDNSRPAASCRAPYDTGVNHTCTTYVEPTTTSCNQYNVWKYGTVVLPGPEDGVSYLQSMYGNAEKVKAQTQQYRHKDVRYVFGGKDSCNCKSDSYVNPDHCTPPTYTQVRGSVGGSKVSKSSIGGESKGGRVLSDSIVGNSDGDSSGDTIMQPMCLNPTTNDVYFTGTTGTLTSCCDTYPDSRDNDLSTSCGSNLQGSNRLQRGLNYMYYLQQYYNKQSRHIRSVDSVGVRGVSDGNIGVGGTTGVYGATLYTPVYEIVPDLQHDMPAFFSSSVVQQWMLDPTTDTTPAHLLHDSTLYGDIVHSIELVVVLVVLAVYLYIVRMYLTGQCRKKGPTKTGLTIRTNLVDEEMVNLEPSEVTHLLYK